MQTIIDTPILPQDMIFSSGVFLKAFEIEINGKKQWRWIVVGIEDDCYFNGEIINVNDYANTFEGLIK